MKHERYYDNQPIKTFKPWVGENYKEGGVLLVGESHYYSEDNENKINDKNTFKEKGDTVEVIEDVVLSSTKKTPRYFSMIFSILKNHLHSNNHQEFYNKIAFCNYFQVVVKREGCDEIFYIHDADFKAHFLNTVKELKPSIIILTSKRFEKLWRYNGIVNELKKLNKKFLAINHPSRPMKEEVRQEIDDVLGKLFSNSL